jgi:thymidylate synthase
MMQNRMLEPDGKTNDVYAKLLIKAYTTGLQSFPRGQETRELIAARVVLDPKDNIITLPGFKTDLKYAKKELEWYYSGSNRIVDMGEYAKVWEKFSDDGVTVNSAYGYQIFGHHPDVRMDQWKWVVNKLKDDKDSRQCVININLPAHKEKPTKDMCCTLALQYFVRDSKLHSITYIRSNDIYFGFRNDIYCFCEFQKKMARELELKVGSYVHVAGSLHLYQPQFKKVEDLMKNVGLTHDTSY